MSENVDTCTCTWFYVPMSDQCIYYNHSLVCTIKISKFSQKSFPLSSEVFIKTAILSKNYPFCFWDLLRQYPCNLTKTCWGDSFQPNSDRGIFRYVKSQKLKEIYHIICKNTKNWCLFWGVFQNRGN